MPETTNFGAQDSSPLGPIGGGEGYTGENPRWDHYVSCREELHAALLLAEPGEVVYIADNTEIDMTVWVRARAEKIVIPTGVTLTSNRGRNGSDGALIISEEFDTRPLILAEGANVRISGLQLRGPDQRVRHEELMHLNENPDITHDSAGYYSFPASTGIETESPGLIVDNCHIWGWGNTAISLLPSAIDAHVHHCDIHHCQRAGLGYGVLLHGATALIEYNRFDLTRHAIAGSGIPGTAYEARYNVCGQRSTSHCFDMHGSEENNVTVDGKSIAGEWIRIHHNTFNAIDQPAIGIRAEAREECDIHHNWFIHPSPETAIIEHDGAAGTLKVHDNVYGPGQEKMD
jgi:hypothetical protein